MSGSCNICLFNINYIDGAIVRVLTAGAIDREFEPQSCQSKDYKIAMCCFFSNHTSLLSMTNWLRIRKNGSSDATCPP